jgi:uncharacterized membrane protein YhaH (DUF805 family)
MLTEEESKFIQYWEANRLRRKRFLWQLGIGLPAGVILVTMIFLNFVSGWHNQAITELQSRSQNKSEGSLILVILIALVLIVVFTAVFSAKHKWDLHEQQYRELLIKREKS